MATYFRAVRPDGGSFNDPSFRWAVELGGVTTHPLRGKAIRKHADGAAGYLSVSVAAADCTGFRWPCRLLVVEPVGRVWTPEPVGLPSKRAGLRWRTVAERPAHEAFGPQGAHAAALIDRCHALTSGDITRLWDAARDAAWDAARSAARDAAWGLVARGLIATAHYDTLTGPWRTAIGPIHPDDQDWKEA